MQSQIFDLEDNKKKISIELTEAEFTEEMNLILAEVAKNAEAPGFRKGKVPLNHLRSQLGEKNLRSDAMSNCVTKYLTQAIEEEDLDAIAVSDMNIKSGMEAPPVIFEATIELRPDLDLKGYQDLKVKIPPLEPTETEIKETETSYLKSFGKLEDVGRGSIKGDHITIDLYASYNGVDVEGMNISDYVYELGSETPIQEMEKELTGAKSGDIIEFNAKHPLEDGTMRVKVLVKKVQVNKVPDLTDELAAEISDHATAEELKKDMLQEMREYKRHNLFHLLQENILNELIQLVPEPLPEPLVEAEMDTMRKQFSNTSNNQETTPEVENLMRQEAVRSVKIDSGLRSVIKQENIEIDEAELQEAVAKINEQIAQLPKEQNAQGLRPNIEAITATLTRQKAMEWLIEHTEIKDDNNLEIDIKDLKPSNEDSETETKATTKTTTKTPTKESVEV